MAAGPTSWNAGRWKTGSSDSLFFRRGAGCYSREDLVLLLELEDIIKFIGGKRLFQCTHTEDDAGMLLWAVNITLAEMPRVNMQRFCVLYADIDKSVSGEV